MILVDCWSVGREAALEIAAAAAAVEVAGWFGIALGFPVVV